MALKERTFIDKCEVLKNGAIQVREKTEIYDTTITTVEAVQEEHDEEGNITQEYVAAVTDVKNSSYHRFVILKNDATPAEVQNFLDNSKV